MKQTISPRPTVSEVVACHAVAELRLLVPVKDGEDAAQAIAYAIRRRAEGRKVAVCLLHVEESASAEPQKLHSFGAPGRGQRRDVFSDAMRMLAGLDIEFSAYVRRGPLVFTILDAAEELDCSEIVLPEQPRGWLRFLSRNIVTTVLARQRSSRVVTVCKDGLPSLTQ